MSKPIQIVSLCSTILLAGLYLIGCETSVDPILELDRPYTLWGFLDMNAEKQEIRVVEIADQLVSFSAEPLDAQFKSTDLMSGEVLEWTQQVFEDSDSTFRHIFSAEIKLEYDHTYVLEVQRRSDGAMSQIEVKMPAKFDLLEQSQQVLDTTVIAPVFLNGDPPHIYHTRVTYVASTIPEDPSSGENPIVHPVTFVYQDQLARLGPGWGINIDLGNDFPDVREDFFNNVIHPNDFIFLRHIDVSMVIGDESLDPPGGVFDPELLVEPGVLSNVDNGFGYVGAGYEVTLRFRPDLRPLLLAGFANCRPGVPMTICTKWDLPLLDDS